MSAELIPSDPNLPRKKIVLDIPHLLKVHECLSEKIRMDILKLLHVREQSQTSLTQALTKHTAKQDVSDHLLFLQQAGIIDFRREKKNDVICYITGEGRQILQKVAVFLGALETNKSSESDDLRDSK